MDGAGSYSVAHRAGLLPTELTGMWGWILLRSPHPGKWPAPAPAPTKQTPGPNPCVVRALARSTDSPSQSSSGTRQEVQE